jgi:hypothetical protein
VTETGTELQTPAANRLVRYFSTPLGKKIFHISEAQAESMTQPDGVADDFGRIPVATISRFALAHPFSVPEVDLNRQYLRSMIRTGSPSMAKTTNGRSITTIETWSFTPCIQPIRLLRFECMLHSTVTHHQKSLAKPPAAAPTSTSYSGNLIAAGYISYLSPLE